MKKIPLEIIKRDDDVLKMMYEDFLVGKDSIELLKANNLLGSPVIDLIALIKSHVEVLEEQLKIDVEHGRFNYITNRLRFWKNVLLYKFSVFINLPNLVAPPFLDSDES